jgi:hypothetical protein
VEETPRQLARIADDLGSEGVENPSAGRKTRPPFRHKKPDFCALFAAEGLQQLETYLAKWAAYNDYLAQRPLAPKTCTRRAVDLPF